MTLPPPSPPEVAARGASEPDTCPRLAGRFWPTEQQRRLLQIALGPLEAGIGIWADLQPTFVLDELEPGSFDLMALVFRRLSSAGLHDPVLERMRGIYRREWVRANVLVEKTKAVAAALLEAGVRPLFVEGAPLAERFYRDRGTRPSWFIDVLVGPAAADVALAVLANAGWRPSLPGRTRPERRALMSEDRSVCVLRTTLSYDFVDPRERERSHELLWETAVTVELDGAEVPAPAPLETLLAVCATGAREQPQGSILWLLDAAMILRTQPLDLGRLLELARSRGQLQRVRESLRYLATLPGVELPSGLASELERSHVPARERLAFALSGGSMAWGGSLAELLARHLAATADAPAPLALARLPRTLGEEWGARHPWQLPIEAGRRTVRRLRRRPSESA